MTGGKSRSVLVSGSTQIEQILINAKLTGYLTKDPSDDQPAYKFRTNEQAARRALEVIPDGWAKINGEWIRITSDGVGYGEFDRERPWRWAHEGEWCEGCKAFHRADHDHFTGQFTI